MRADLLAGKFYPPQLDDSTLARESLLKTLSRRWGRGRQALWVLAQAGQGKSTLGAQFVASLGIPFAWYQLGPEDEDPVYLLGTLYAALKHSLPGFRSALLEPMLAQGDVTAPDTPRLAALLAGELKTFLHQETCLVLDDLHLLENAPLSLGLLAAFLSAAPPRLRFVLLSRRPVPALEPSREALVLRNADLAFSKTEVAELFTQKLHLGLSARQIQELHRLTEGWVMGLLMLAAAMESGGREIDFQKVKPEEVLDYFFHEVLGAFTPPWRRTLLKLSLLEEIPAEIARIIAAEEGADPDLLLELERRNLFLRQLDESGNAFGFHQLFRDCLRALAQQDLTEAERRNSLRQAGVWHWQRQRAEEALHLYLEATDYDTAQQILSQVGMELRAANRIVTLRAALERIPEEVIREHAWLCFFVGVSYQDVAPEKALAFLERARLLFSSEGNHLGELFVVIDIIVFHFIVDGYFQKGRLLLPRAKELFLDFQSLLPNQLSTLITANIANGYSFFNADLDTACELYDLVEISSEIDNNINFACYYLLTKGYYFLFRGRLDLYSNTLEVLNSKINYFLLSSLVTAGTYSVISHYLAAVGDRINFLNLKQSFEEKLGTSVYRNLVTGKAIDVYESELNLESGLIEPKLNELERVANQQDLNLNARSGTLSYIAYLMSIASDTKFLTIAKESLDLQRVFCGPYFRGYNTLLVAGSYVLQKMDQAEPLLMEVIEISKTIGEEFLRCAAYAHLAYLHLTREAPIAALDSLHCCLEIMRRNKYPRFFSWCPQLMAPLLPLAVANGIEPEYARHLAAERLELAILDDGTALPLLQFQTLGHFEVVAGKGVVLRGAELSPIQRRLLSLLLAAPEMGMPQEEIQRTLWPDSPPEKSRSKLDTLLSRLRAVLEERLPQSAKHYLSLSKGVLRLENCRLDARRFMEEARAGLRHVRKEEPWQAGCAFRRAFHLWYGGFAVAAVDDAVLRFKEDLEQLAIEAALAWSTILEHEGGFEEGIRNLSKVLPLDPSNEQIVKTLHRFCLKNGRPAEAKKILRNYRKALEDMDCSPAEIAMTLANL